MRHEHETWLGEGTHAETKQEGAHNYTAHAGTRNLRWYMGATGELAADVKTWGGGGA